MHTAQSAAIESRRSASEARSGRVVGRMVGRLDRWLWCVRVFKSLSIAAKACKASQVRLNGRLAKKPTAKLKVGDVVEVRY